MNKKTKWTMARPNDKETCLSECLSKLFGIDLCRVPNFHKAEKLKYYKQDGFWEHVRRWLREEMDCTCLIFEGISEKEAADKFNGLPLIAMGESNGSGCFHAVIWQNGKIIYDPAQSGFGLKKEPENYLSLVPYNVCQPCLDCKRWTNEAKK